MDSIHYKIKEEGRYVGKAIYTLLGFTPKGEKEIFGLYLSDNERENYWLTCNSSDLIGQLPKV